jgi:CRP-like cAMP-binding protein
MSRETPHTPASTAARLGAAPPLTRKPRPSEIAVILGGIALFRDLGPGLLARIAAGTVIVEAPRGSVLFRPGDACSGFHIVIEGRIKLSLHNAQGAERVVELPGPGQSFGEAAMFLRIPYRVSAEALADSRLLHVSANRVFAELDSDPRLAHRIIAGLSMRLHNLVSDLESQSLQSGTQRVIGFLLSLVDAEAKSGTVARLPARKNVIASRLNLTHEHFSRILHGLAAAGAIRVEGQDILIPDVEALRRHPG